MEGVQPELCRCSRVLTRGALQESHRVPAAPRLEHCTLPLQCWGKQDLFQVKVLGKKPGDKETIAGGQC